MSGEDRVPTLEELRRELDALGMVAVPFRDEIHIRRSTLEYIKVRVDDGVLRCEPWIGFFSQAKSTWLLLAIEMVILWSLQAQRLPLNAGLAMAFAGILGFGLHGLRYTLAEVTIGRVQSVWLELRARQRVAQLPSPSSSSSPPGTPALSEGDGPISEVSAHMRRKTPV